VRVDVEYFLEREEKSFGVAVVEDSADARVAEIQRTYD